MHALFVHGFLITGCSTSRLWHSRPYFTILGPLLATVAWCTQPSSTSMILLYKAVAGDKQILSNLDHIVSLVRSEKYVLFLASV